MTRSVFEENLNRIDSVSADVIRRIIPDNMVEIVTSKSGKPVPVLHTDGKRRPLHSLVAPERESSKESDPHGFLSQPSFVIACGLGAGYHLTGLLESPHTTELLIIEPHQALLRTLLEYVDLRHILDDPRVRLCTDTQTEVIKAYIVQRYHPAIHGGLRVVRLRSVEQVYTPEYRTVVDAIQSIIRDIQGDFSTQARFGSQWIRNAIFNLPSVSHHSMEIPRSRSATVVAAGPSLENDLPDIALRAGQGEIIVATDTSYPALMRAGIVPAVVVTIDSQLISNHHYRDTPTNQTLVVLALTTAPSVAYRAPNRLFVTTSHPFSRYVATFDNAPPRADASGGNVTYTAVYIAKALGASAVTLFGADYSYPEGKPYARGTYVYPYLHVRSKRTAPLLSGALNLVFRSTPIRRIDTTDSITYTTDLMQFYHDVVSRLIAAPIRVPEFIQPGPPFRWRSFLSDYSENISMLRKPSGALRNYLDSLSARQKQSAVTLLPQTLSLLQNMDSPIDAFFLARKATIRYADWVLSRFP